METIGPHQLPTGLKTSLISNLSPLFLCPNGHAVLINFLRRVSHICPFMRLPQQSYRPMPATPPQPGAPSPAFLSANPWATDTVVKLISLKHSWSYQQRAEKSPLITNPRCSVYVLLLPGMPSAWMRRRPSHQGPRGQQQMHLGWNQAVSWTGSPLLN